MKNHPDEAEALGRPAGSGTPLSPERWIRHASVFYGLLLAAALALAAFRGASLCFRDAAAARAGPDWLRDPALGALTAAAAILASHVFTRRTRAGRELAQAFGALLGPLALRHCVVLALLSGVAEEAFFRGALQPLLGWALASLLFGLVHFVPRREFAVWTLFSIVAGGLLGGLYEWTGNLIAPVVAHVGINAVNLRWLALRYAPR